MTISSSGRRDCFVEATGDSSDLKIELRKVIPHGAGLGGGSSDAAAVLLGLNRMLNGRTIERRRIGRKFAAQIGSDVPFFIYESAAICRGRGELVTRATLPRVMPLLLMKPAFGVPTPWAYANGKNRNSCAESPMSRRPSAMRTFVNDLERPVFEKYVFLARLKMWLLRAERSRSRADVGLRLNDVGGAA